MWNYFWAFVGIAGAIAGIALLVYLQLRGPREHAAEDAARAHFDATGRWPDEDAG